MNYLTTVYLKYINIIKNIMVLHPTDPYCDVVVHIQTNKNQFENIISLIICQVDP